MSSRDLRIARWGLVAATVVAARVSAAEGGDAATVASTPPYEGGHGRVLNGHVFMPAQDVPGALITTSFASGLLVGIGKTTSSIQIGDQTLSGSFEYAGIGAVLAYEYAIFDNLSARVALNEVIYSGITGRSAIVVGSRLQGGLGAGLTYSLPIGDSLRVGALFDVAFTPNLGLTIGSALRSVVESCQSATGCDVRPGNAFEQANVLTLQPALAASWGVVPALGLTANVGYIHASQSVNGKELNGEALSLGLAGDLDLNEVWRFPLGLQVQFSWTAPSGSGGLQHVTDLGGGIFYTGKRNLALGIQVIDRQFAVTPDVHVSWNTIISNIGMRYYW
jgi:hypothetical protein